KRLKDFPGSLNELERAIIDIHVPGKAQGIAAAHRIVAESGWNRSRSTGGLVRIEHGFCRRRHLGNRITHQDAGPVAVPTHGQVMFVVRCGDILACFGFRFSCRWRANSLSAWRWKRFLSKSDGRHRKNGKCNRLTHKTNSHCYWSPGFTAELHNPLAGLAKGL